MTPADCPDDAATQPLPVLAAEPAATVAPPSRAARLGVWVGAALVLLLVGLLLANAWVTRSAEEAASERASQALGADAAVRLVGWPVGLRLVSGSPIDALVEASGVPLPGTSAVLSRLEIELDDVVVDRRGLAGDDQGLEASRGRFVAELDTDAVRQLAGLIGRLPLVGIELRSGVARLDVAGFPLLEATAEVVDGGVEFRPTLPLASFASVRLEFEELPLGFRADRVEIRRDVLRLEGSARGIRLG
jgi:hypothetical protein